MTTVMGQRLLRREDPPLMTGEARFVDDLASPARSGWPSCAAPTRTRGSRRSRRLPRPRSRACSHVFTGEDLRGDWAGAMPCAWPVTADMKNPDHWPVAVGKVVFVGEPVAVVLARTRARPTTAPTPSPSSTSR